MSTNLIKLKTTEEVMSGYTPVYAPFYSLFLDNAIAYDEVVGKVDFKRASTIGDIRAKHILPKDTEMKTISVGESSKSFKKYFLGNQYHHSLLQDGENSDDIVAQVLDEQNLQIDEMFMYGDGGTSANTVINNGLYWSADPNYTLKSSIEIAKDTNGSYAGALHSQIMASADDAERITGNKLIIIYGNLGATFDSLYVNSSVPFKTSLQQTLPPSFQRVIKLPTALAPSGQNGWIIVNMNQILTHYTTLPKLDDQGINAEKKYAWFNFLMGSLMLEVKAKDGIIRQPTTLQA